MIHCRVEDMLKVLYRDAQVAVSITVFNHILNSTGDDAEAATEAIDTEVVPTEFYTFEGATNYPE